MTAQFIVRRLTQKTRQMWPLRYETVRLLFSDDSFVRAADREPRAFEEVERLLQLGERPLGFIARLSERRGQPCVQPWVRGDDAALVKLNVYIAEDRHPHGDGPVDVKHCATCEIYAKDRLPQNLSLLFARPIIQWPDRRCDA